jgi:hypothetical protein
MAGCGPVRGAINSYARTRGGRAAFPGAEGVVAGGARAGRGAHIQRWRLKYHSEASAETSISPSAYS